MFSMLRNLRGPRMVRFGKPQNDSLGSILQVEMLASLWQEGFRVLGI